MNEQHWADVFYCDAVKQRIGATSAEQQPGRLTMSKEKNKVCPESLTPVSLVSQFMLKKRNRIVQYFFTFDFTPHPHIKGIFKHNDPQP